MKITSHFLNWNPYLLLVTVFVFAGASLSGQTEPATIFADHMVLQQNTTVNIWGRDAAGQQIQVSAAWGEESLTTTDATGNWKLQLRTPPAGGPYTLTIRGSKTIQLEDILIGEVWLCSGQSNMEMPMRGYNNQPVLGSNDAKLHPGNNRIRLFHVPHTARTEPLDTIYGEWLVGSPATLGSFSATAYFFAHKLREGLGDIPIGLVHPSWGGSSAEAWTDEATFAQLYPDRELPTAVPEQGVIHTPALLYNAMMHPLVGYTIKGSIWYQGESNIGRYQDYAQLVTAMVNGWRKNWDQGDFPFYFVQIAPYNYSPNSPVALQREAQENTVGMLKNSGMAVSLDVGNCTNIHPADKQTIGSRLAYIALAKTYGIEGLAYSGPVYDGHEITEDGRIRVSFQMAEQGLSSFGKPLSGFTIAGADGFWYPAQAQINRDKTLTVWSKNVPKPVAVRYAFDNCPEASLFNTDGFPASSFRTDDW